MAGEYFQIKMQILFVFEIQLGGGNSNMFYFHPYLGKIHILTHIFQMDFLAFNAFFVVFFSLGGSAPKLQFVGSMLGVLGCTD